MDDIEEIRRLIRAKLADGRLPSYPMPRIRAALDEGKPVTPAGTSSHRKYSSKALSAIQGGVCSCTFDAFISGTRSAGCLGISIWPAHPLVDLA